MQPGLSVYKSKGEWRWRFVARNRKIVAASTEGFKRKAGAVNNLRLISEMYATDNFTIEGK